jgi:hypothetical protein
MLQHFTWQQFLVAALILSLIWYAAVLLVFYRQELNDFLSGSRRPLNRPEPLPHVWEEEFEGGPLHGEDNLMGKPAMPEGMSRLSFAQFGFAPTVEKTGGTLEAVPGEAGKNEGPDTKLGLIPDVLEELKRIFHVLERDKGSKADFISLFGLVSAKYPKIKGSANQQALNAYIRENVLFPISDEELDGLWV